MSPVVPAALRTVLRPLARWLDRVWYGLPVDGARDFVSPARPVWLRGLTPAQLLATHQHQHDGRETTPNDCAVASMAMLVHQALLLAGYAQVRVPYPDLARAMDRAPWYGLGFYRVPWVGAVPPGRAAAALRCLAQAFPRHGQPLPWRVRLQGRASLTTLVTHLAQGHPTMVYGVWANGVPHAVVVAGYDAAADVWYLLDPAYPQPYRGRPAFARWSTAHFLAWWDRRYFAYQRRTVLALTHIPRAVVAAAAEPVPQTAPLVPAA